MIKGRLNLLFQTAFCIKVKRGREVTILFKFVREMCIVISLQDCVRKTRSFCIKTKNPLH